MKGSTTKPVIIKTFLIGLVALLPLGLTIALIAWIVGFLVDLLGPESATGRLLISFGLSFAETPILAYCLGIIIVLAAIYILGFVLQYGFKDSLKRTLNKFISRIPMIGNIYDLAERFVDMFDKRDDQSLKSMTPVWCFFGGEGCTAVLALMPNPEPVSIAGTLYQGILVPSAPVPVGGGLLFVPRDWVKPASFGIDGLTSIYVSMGVTAPSVLNQGEESQKKSITDIQSEQETN